jgi:uncharacterized membrane protein YgcG
VAQAKDAWRSIQQRFQQVPKCFHGEAAEQKRVNKSGPNQGRYFWRCARPAGPRPEGDCGYFKWVEARPGDPPHLTLGPSKSSGPGKGGGSRGGGLTGGKGSGRGGGGGGAGSAKRLKT